VEGHEWRFYRSSAYPVCLGRDFVRLRQRTSRVSLNVIFFRVTSHHSLKSQPVGEVLVPARCSLLFKQPTYLDITLRWLKA
jgi:hypothetical protein